jgi:autotransporter-associated beta strand protein
LLGGTFAADTITMATAAAAAGRIARAELYLSGGTLEAWQILSGDNVTNCVRLIQFTNGVVRHKAGADLVVDGGVAWAMKTGGVHVIESDAGRTVTLEGNIAGAVGAGGITKTGAGLLILNGTNTCTGTNTVVAGGVGGHGWLGGSLVFKDGTWFQASTGQFMTVASAVSIGNDAYVDAQALRGGRHTVLRYTGALTGRFNHALPRRGFSASLDHGAGTNSEIAVVLLQAGAAVIVR